MDKGWMSLGVILLYLVVMLAITIITGHRDKKAAAKASAVDFFLAGRGVSSVLLPLTMIAAMQSTFAFLGAPGMYYSHGISYIVIVLSQVWVALMVVFFGNKIRKLASEHGYMSLGDYLEDRFHSKYLKKALVNHDKVTEEAVDRACHYLAIATGNLINTISPDVVIFGGGVVEATGNLFRDKVLAEIDRYCMTSIRPTVELKTAALGDDSNIYGSLAMIHDAEAAAGKTGGKKAATKTTKTASAKNSSST